MAGRIHHCCSGTAASGLKLFSSQIMSRLGRDDADWEVCEDNGFVYMRRHRYLSSMVGRLPIDSAEELRRNHHARKKRCLITIRDRYQREVEQCEDLSASLLRLLASRPPEATSEAGTSSVASPRSFHLSPPAIDSLILELETQEAIFRKISDLCDFVDLFCEAHQDRLTHSLLDLPIWESPRALMRSLCD